ncbi:type II secretion system F family protein [Angustibacter luteus]|uniref:Type II secretion system F family protein n=1 Tax=Angustibacter luteus TaxID=658456 RepID=A0ABW1JJZ0_9ACTN
MSAVTVSCDWLGCLIGLALGCGILLLLSGLPFLRRPGLAERLGPYVHDVSAPSRLLRSGGERGRVGAPAPARAAVERLCSALDRLLGGSTSLGARLERAGLGLDVPGFRAQQVLCGAGGAAAGAALSAAAWSRHPRALLPLAFLVVAAAGAGVMARDWYLTHQVRRREQRMLEELPTVAEMLALAVGAGEGPVAALHRVAALTGGELAGELRRALSDTHAGASLVLALQGVSRRTGLPALARFVDGVVIAVERGTPLADVLRAQAQDVRQSGQRALMDTAGRKEVAMMVPVVFGVLPVTVLFAVYPGFAFLRLGL